MHIQFSRKTCIALAPTSKCSQARLDSYPAASFSLFLGGRRFLVKKQLRHSQRHRHRPVSHSERHRRRTRWVTRPSKSSSRVVHENSNEPCALGEIKERTDRFRYIELRLRCSIRELETREFARDSNRERKGSTMIRDDGKDLPTRLRQSFMDQGICVNIRRVNKKLFGKSSCDVTGHTTDGTL